MYRVFWCSSIVARIDIFLAICAALVVLWDQTSWAGYKSLEAWVRLIVVPMILSPICSGGIFADICYLLLFTSPGYNVMDNLCIHIVYFAAL